MRLSFTPQAEADLAELEAYWRSDGAVAAARRYLDDLLSAINGLSLFPASHPLVPEVGAGVRAFLFRRRVTVLYRVEAEQLTVIGVFGAGRLVTLSWDLP